MEHLSDNIKVVLSSKKIEDVTFPSVIACVRAKTICIKYIYLNTQLDVDLAAFFCENNY